MTDGQRMAMAIMAVGQDRSAPRRCAWCNAFPLVSVVTDSEGRTFCCDQHYRAAVKARAKSGERDRAFGRL